MPDPFDPMQSHSLSEFWRTACRVDSQAHVLIRGVEDRSCGSGVVDSGLTASGIIVRWSIVEAPRPFVVYGIHL
jgi:hypothetical protein